MLSAHCFFKIEFIFIMVLGIVPPLLLLILRKCRREELPYEKVMEICLGKMKSNARFFASEESFKKMSSDLETYVALLALFSTGRLKVRSSPNKKVLRERFSK